MAIDPFPTLAKAIPEPRCELRHSDGWTLLIATILSAQSTDKRVNMVTPSLFARWPTPRALGDADLAEVEEVVRSTGFYRQKARNIVEASKALADLFDGDVPRDLDTLAKLRGVGRKTANLVLGTVYGLATGIVVDTHVGRVSRRLGLTVAEDPVEVERDLCTRLPQTAWVDGGHRLLLHGRYVCVAKKPRCTECPLAEACPSAEAAPVGSVDARIVAEGLRIATGYAATTGSVGVG